jgi:hypothetical protein
MPTDVMTLEEYADMLQELAESWNENPPAVLIGDLASENLNVTAKDGYTQYGDLGYAQECFEDNGVWTLGSKVDTRFLGTALVDREHLSEDAQEQLADEGGDDQ